jgi:sulfate/thiosulfate transport system permease protein
VSGGVTEAIGEAKLRPGRNSLADALIKALFIALTLAFITAVLLAPLITVFVEAFGQGIELYWGSFRNSETAAAIRTTLTVAAIVVPVNTLFGIAAAWAIAKFDFRGKTVLLTLTDLPLAVSPVVAGLVYMLLFGAHGWFASWLQGHDIQIVFALPGIILATMFVTFPYVARELIPLMQQLGNDEEEAAITLGAGGLMTFFHVTLPKVRWGLLYGVILCNARAMGEFGAVAVVSANIRGGTTTMPLHIEQLYQDYSPVAAFAVASLLALLAVVTLVLKTLLEWRMSAR